MLKYGEHTVSNNDIMQIKVRIEFIRVTYWNKVAFTMRDQLGTE